MDLRDASASKNVSPEQAISKPVGIDMAKQLSADCGKQVGCLLSQYPENSDLTSLNIKTQPIA